jgi:hypothetical protein
MSSHHMNATIGGPDVLRAVIGGELFLRGPGHGVRPRPSGSAEQGADVVGGEGCGEGVLLPVNDVGE